MGRLSMEDGYATIEFERFYNHPPEKVWGALTDNDQLSSWFLSRVRIEGGPGGFIESWFGYPVMHVEGKITAWDPPHLLEHEWNIQPNQVLPEGEFSRMRWELIGSSGGTILKLTHHNLTRQTMAGLRTGLDPAPANHLILERLGDYLSEMPFGNAQERMKELMDSYHRFLQ